MEMFKEIEGFEAILTTLTLAKELHDVNRFEIVQRYFFDVLCWDGYYENILEVIASIFTGYYSKYDDDYDMDISIFYDDVISNYFIYAWEYGQQHKLQYDQNPYVTQAQNEVRDWLNGSTCVDWRLLSYTKTKKTARQSKLIICIANCSCNAIEHVAYSLIQLYSWFANKCEEFKALKAVQSINHDEIPLTCTNPSTQEVTAA